MIRLTSAALFLLLSACGPADSPLSENPLVQSAENFDSDSAIIESGITQIVEVHEGTNMSAAVSPDGSRIVSSIQGTLFVMNVEGGDAQSITDYYFDAREPSWSRDGSAIVFHGYRNGTWDIWQIGADGSDAQALTNDEFDDREPTFSPASDAIAFSSDRDGNYDIWLLENGQLQQVTSETENAHSPAWSPDGTSLAFAVNVGGGNYEIRTVDISSASITTRHSEPGSISGLSWKPDGSALSYQIRTYAGSEGMQADLKLLELDSGQDEILSAENADVFPFRASWTENNTLIYTASGEIRRMIIDEAETVIPFSASFNIERKPYQRRQRNYDGAEKSALGITAPVISNDGEWVAFSALADIWLLQVSSGALSQITSDNYANRSPVFSADGNRIAFLSDRSGSSVVWLFDRTTQRTEKLDGDLEITNMSWSPEGERLAGFMAAPGNPLSAQLAIVDLDSGEPQMLYQPIPSQKVSWSADGQQIITAVLDRFSTRYREGVYNLLAIDIQTGDTIQTTPTPHDNMTSLVMSADGETFTYVQEALLWRASLDGTGEPVRLTDSLTDDPSFSADGEYAVFMSGDKMFRLSTSTGEQLDISPQLAYTNSIPEKSWVLRVGNLFNGTDNSYQQDVDIVIAGNRIQSIEPQAPRSVEIVDMSDKTVIPGMFEMHAHLGDLSESQGRNLLSYGITSVRDPGSHPYLAKSRQEAWDSGKMIGPRTHITGYLVDGNRVYYSIAEGLGSVEHVNRVIQRNRMLKLDFIKTYVRLPDDWQKMIVDAAHKMGIPTSSHELFPAANNGMDHVEHIGGTSRRGYQPKVSQTGHVYQDVIDLLAKSGMGITPTVVLSGGFSVVAFEDDDLFESAQFNEFYGPNFPRRNRPGADVNALANGMAIRKLVDAGALVVTGTDAPIVPLGIGLHGELRLFTRAGLSPFETLRAATASSATAAGVFQDTGSLEIGKLADMVVIDGDPLNDIKDADNVVMTIKNGRAYPLQELLNGNIQ